MTNELIGCCGLDCEKCDARLATLNNETSCGARPPSFGAS